MFYSLHTTLDDKKTDVCRIEMKSVHIAGNAGELCLVKLILGPCDVPVPRR